MTFLRFLAVAIVLPALPDASSAQPVPRAPTAPSSSEVLKLDPFSVTASPEGYAAAESVAATRIAVPVKDLPINVQVIQNDFLNDALVLDIVDALRYKGVNANRDIRFNSTFIRGFNNRILKRNGVRRDLNWGTANVERVEIVKGPASILYGEANPGGTILYVTKKPVARDFARVEAQFGGDSFYRGIVDVGARLGGSDRALFRFIVERQDSQNHYDGAYVDKWMFNPTFTWRISPKLTLDLEYEHSNHEEQQAMYFFKATRAVLDAPALTLANLPATVPFFHREIVGLAGQVTFTEFFSRAGNASVSERFQAQSPDSAIRLRTDWYEATLNYRFNNDWVLRAKFTHELTDDEELEFGSNGNSDLLSGGILGVGDWRARDNVNDRVTAFVETTGKYKLGSWENTAIFGYEHRRDDLNAAIFVPPTRMNSPVTGQPLPVRGNRVVLPVAEFALVRYSTLVVQPRFTPRASSVNTRNTGYGFNQIESPDRRWLALLGLRYEKGENNPFSAGVRPQNTFDTWARQLGVAFRPDSDLTLFANISESYLPIEAVNPDGGTFQPEAGIGYEIGLRSFLLGGKVATMLSAWENTRDDILQRDDRRTFEDPVNNPTNRTYNIQGGSQRTRGVDTEINYSPAPEWQLTAAVSWIPYAKTEQNTSNPLQVGRRMRYVPEWAGSVWAKYQPAAGWRLYGGASFQSETHWDDTGLSGTYRFKAWANWDLGIGRTFEFGGRPVSIDLFGQNITDNELTTVIRPQDRRRLFLKTSLSF